MLGFVQSVVAVEVVVVVISGRGPPVGGGALSITCARVCAALETPFFISPKSLPRYYFQASLPLFRFYCFVIRSLDTIFKHRCRSSDSIALLSAP